MKNEAKIKGNKNLIIQGTKDSNINVEGEKSHKKQSNVYAMIGIVVAILTVIITIIIGWDSIINFFQK